MERRQFLKQAAFAAAAASSAGIVIIFPEVALWLPSQIQLR